MEEKRPTDEQLAKYRKNAQDQSLSAEVRAKFKAVVDKFDNVAEKIGEDVVKVAEPKKTRGRKPASTAKPKTKQTGTDIEKAKAEIKAKTGKTEAECESIIEQYRALRTKSQEGKRKAEQASADNKKRVEKLDKKGDIIEGTNEKTADAVIESTAKDVVEKIEKEVEAVEAKAEKEAKAEVAKDKTITTPKEKKEAVEAKVEKKVAEKTKTIVKRVVIDTSALLTSIAESLGKFDKDSQKEFLIKLRSDIDKLLSKYAFGGLTDGGVQVMNIQQSNMSSSSVNPSHFGEGGAVKSNSKEVKEKIRKHILESVYDYNENEFSNFNDASKHLTDEFRRVADYPNNLKRFPNDQKRFQDYLQGVPFNFYFYNDDIENYLNGLGINPKGKKYSSDQMWNLYSLLIWREVEPTYKSKKMANGGVVGQEIVFDDGGEENKGVIKEIHDTTGDYIVNTDDGRTILVQLDRDVISLGGMRKVVPMEAPRKRFGFFNEGGGVDGKIPVKKLDKVVQHYNGKTWELDKYPANVGGSAKEWLGKAPLDLDEAKALVFEIAYDEAYDYEDEINNAEDIDDLKSIISDFKHFQSDNTYNQSWWGGVVDWSSLTESGDLYERALVFVNMHIGGDPRGNYYETQAFELDQLDEDYPPYYSRLTYYIDTPQGTLILDTEDMEGYTLIVNEDATGTYEEGDYVTLDELEDKFDLSDVSLYAQGGMTEHGLRVGDEIVRDYSEHGFNEVQVKDGYKNNYVVNLDKGIRSKPFKKGGITQMLRNRRGK
jgi:hypothetical protein